MVDVAPVVDTGEDDVDNLWAAEEEKFKLKPVPPEMPNCPVHGIICKKGICKKMSKIVKARERAQKEQERKNSRGRGRNGGGEGLFFFAPLFCSDFTHRQLEQGWRWRWMEERDQ